MASKVFWNKTCKKKVFNCHIFCNSIEIFDYIESLDIIKGPKVYITKEC